MMERLGRLLQRGSRSRRALGARDPDAATTRRVGWRLAALTVGLIAALLLGLGITIYTTTDNLLYGSLQNAVQKRSDATVQYIRNPQPSQPNQPAQPNPPPRPQRPPGSSGIGNKFRDADRAGGVFQVVVDAHLRAVSRYNPPDGGTTLPDPAAARRTLREGLPTLYSICQVNATGPFLVYTTRVQAPQGGGLLIVQTSIAERQYLDSRQKLLDVLLAASLLGLLASGLISGVLARRALRPIQVAMRRQRDFVADAAHELRTPLAIMRGASELGLSAGSADEQGAALEQVLAQNAHLTRLVEDLSTLARADSGAVSLERAPVDLSRLVVETVEGVGALAEDRGVRLSVEAPEGTRVVGDAGRLRQVLLILLDNALKHTPDHGFITVRVARESGQARLQVRDSGPGIAPEDLPRLFERFYRADKARSGEGSGLGLAIGRWIAEAHGGHIAAANATEHGALFTVTLPLAAA